MGYRDELEAIRARADQLEEELVSSRSEVDRLRGRRLEHERATRNRLLGGPMKIRLEIELDGEIGEDGYELIVSALREELDSTGGVDRVGRSLSWRMIDPSHSRQSGRHVEAMVEVRDGKTRIRVRENLGHVAVQAFTGYGSALSIPVLACLLPVLAGSGVPVVLISAIVVAWLAAVFGGVRLGYAYTTRKREDQLRQLCARLAAIAREDIGQPIIQTRIETEEARATDEDEEASTSSTGGPMARRPLRLSAHSGH